MSGNTCPVCSAVLTDYKHDHRPDGRGLDDGPYLPGKAPRKKQAAKPREVVASIRAVAWETRREKYGPQGHR